MRLIESEHHVLRSYSRLLLLLQNDDWGHQVPTFSIDSSSPGPDPSISSVPPPRLKRDAMGKPKVEEQLEELHQRLAEAKSSVVAGGYHPNMMSGPPLSAPRTSPSRADDQLDLSQYGGASDLNPPFLIPSSSATISALPSQQKPPLPSLTADLIHKVQVFF